MTFDEAIAKIGTYLKNNDLSNSDNNDRFFYIILNDLRKEYEIKEPKFKYAIQRSIMSNSDSLKAVRNLLANGYQIIDKSVLSDGRADYIEYILSKEIKSE